MPVTSRSTPACARKARWCSPITKIAQLDCRTRKAPGSPSAPRGVTVEQVEPLAYRVSYGKKSVVFALNDLSQVKPADGARIAVTPYMEYRSPKDLAIFDRCATSRRIAAERDAACFALALEGDHGANARPLAMQRHAR
jgi:hypothetical protein